MESLLSIPNDRTPAPWETEVHGVVSLLEMLQFYGDVLIFELSAISAAEVKLGFEKDESQIIPAAAAMVFAKLNVLMALYREYGMDSSAAQCKRIIDKIDAKGRELRCGELREGLKQLRERSEDEFKTQFFVHLDPKQAALFQKPIREWESVASRFNDVRYNLEESAKCFALERYGAAVFHIMQVAEYGVIQVGGLLGVLGDKPGWSCLKRLQDLIAVPYPQRSPLAQQHSKLLENVLPLAAAMKDAWRHKLDHVDNQIRWVDTDFSPQVAEEIISATRGFMRKLAAELPR
jgi:hypothetical protein